MRIYKLFLLLFFALSGCINPSLRFPSSSEEIYKLSGLKQDLQLAAQNNVLFHVSNETLFESESTVIDGRCQDNQKPFWSEKLSVYLNLMRSHPDWYQKFHVLEIKKGDSPKAIIEKDLDGAAILSIQYGKSESRGRVSLKTQLPCNNQKAAEFLGKEIIKTQFDFPSVDTVTQLMNMTPERSLVKRFEFSNTFLNYLAERGFILKFTHELSFEKNSQNKFVMSEILNQLGKETQQKKDTKYIHLWMKILNDLHKSDDIVQFFSIENQINLKAGLKFITNENTVSTDVNAKRYFSTQMFVTYKIDAETIENSNLNDLDVCLSQIPNQKTNLFMRQPSSDVFTENKALKDYSCLLDNSGVSARASSASVLSSVQIK